MTREIKKPLTLAFLSLAILGWLAAAFSFWNQSNGHERPRTAEKEVAAEQDNVLAQVNAAQQKLATVQSALSVTTRLRDEGAEALQEVQARSAQVRKELALASNQLDDIQQTIAIRNSELTTMNKRVETGRLREAQEKRKADSSSTPAGTPKPLAAETATSITKESAGSTRATKGETTKSDTIQIDHGVPSTVVHKNAADQQQAGTQVEATQKKLTTVKSSLATTTRLRDEAAQALQEIRAKSAAMKKDLATAREQLNAVEQQIAARNSELLPISKQPDTARLQESHDKQEADASPRPAATVTGAMATTAATTAKKNPTPSAKPTDSASPSGATLLPAPAAAATSAVANQSAPNRTEGDGSSIAQSSPPAATVSPEPSPDPAAAPKRKARKLTETSGSSAVIGPGDFSLPSEFERHSGRVSRTP
jgi:predicted  nucleic acid-binding Zn-ribbon protein